MQQDKPISTRSRPSDDNQDGQVQLNPDGSPQEPNTGFGEQDVSGETGRSYPVNCKQKVGPKNLYELDEDGYYSSEPEAEASEPPSESELEESSSEGDSNCEPSDSVSETPSDAVPTEKNIDQHLEQIQIWMDDSDEDLRNLVLVLIADPLSGSHAPDRFDAETLESTIKLATKYNHPDLRDWATQQLDRLKSIKPPLPHDCGVTELGSETIEGLCMRDEPITEEEAFVLGYGLLLKVMAQREKNQYEKGRRVGMGQSSSQNNSGENATGSVAVSNITQGLPGLLKFNLPSPQALQTELPASP